jgi:hypothetical protein
MRIHRNALVANIPENLGLKHYLAFRREPQEGNSLAALRGLPTLPTLPTSAPPAPAHRGKGKERANQRSYDDVLRRSNGD